MNTYGADSWADWLQGIAVVIAAMGLVAGALLGLIRKIKRIWKELEGRRTK